MNLRGHPLTYGVLYGFLSLAIEAGLMIAGGLRPPRDNAILGPVVLTVPPLLAAWIFGYRRPNALLILAGLTAVMTLAITIASVKLTGINVGLLQPLIVRPLAGMVAVMIASRMR